MTMTHTHTRTHIVITPANPFLACTTCGETGPVNMPCFDRGGYDGLCPSWSPVDGCQCLAHLGYVPHPAELARA